MDLGGWIHRNTCAGWIKRDYNVKSQGESVKFGLDTFRLDIFILDTNSDDGNTKRTYVPKIK